MRKENAKLQDLLAKERYRIKHLIRAIGEVMMRALVVLCVAAPAR